MKKFVTIVLFSLACAMAQAAPSEELKALMAEEKALKQAVKEKKESEKIVKLKVRIVNLKAQLSAETVVGR
jgi:hypothetical protein